MKQLLSKAFVISFYKAFIGFFLLLIIIFGVFIKGEVHVMLGYQIIQSSYAMAGLTLLFGIYSTLHWYFQKKLLIKPNYKVFHQMGLIKPFPFFKEQFYIWLSNHTIVILYSVFLSALCIDLKLWGTLAILWGILIILYFIYTLLIYYQLRHPLSEIRINRNAFGKAKPFVISYHFWFLYHLKENRPLLLLASKLVSLFLLNLFFSAFQSGDYDNRWLQFAILCTAYVNLPLLKEKISFETSTLSYFLNLPISFLKKFKSHFSQVMGVIIPEILFILYQLTTTDLSIFHITLIFLTIALHLGLYGLFNYIDDITRQGKYAFIAFFLLFFAILYHLPWLILATVGLIVFLLSIKSPYEN